MRKFTSLMLMLLCAVTTWAQTFPESSTEDSPKYYTIKSYNRGGYITNVGLEKGIEHIDWRLDSYTGSMWYFEQANDNGGYYFVNYLKDGESKIYLGSDKKTSTTPAVWYVLPNGVNTEGICISSTNPIDNDNNSCIDANNYNSGVGAWHPSASDWHGTTWVLEERTIQDLTDAFLSATITNASSAHTAAYNNIGTVIGRHIESSVTALNDAINTAKSIETATLNDIITLQAAIDGLKIVLPTAGKYYQIHSALAAFTATKAVYSNGSPGWKTLNNDDKSFYWKAIETENGIALQNVNDDKYLSGTGWSMSDSPVDITVKILSDTDSEKGYEYAIISGGRHMHANNHNNGNGNEGNLISYETNSANSASAWYIVEVEYEQFYDITYNFKYNDEIKFTNIVSLKEGASYPDVTIALPYGVVSNYAKPEGTVSAEKTFDFTLSIEKELPFEVAADASSIEQWYYIQMHTNQPGYIGEIADDNTVNVYWKKTATNDNYADFVWGFTGNIWDGIKVINKNREMALTSTGGGNVTLTAEGTNFFITGTSETSANATNGFCLRRFDSNQYLNANYGAGKLNHWSSTDAGSTFFLSEYKEFETTIGTAGYATLFLDYPAYIPEGVEVYVAKETINNYVTLEQVEGTLPANTGVILKNEGTYAFPLSITSANGATSLLQGTVETTDITPAENTTYYVLAKGENGIGLYKDELAGGTFRNNANKAYLPVVVESGNAAPSYSFNFDWAGTTGIEGVVAEGAQDGAIYDITGRRVKAITAPGIYIVNGRKVVK